jgi:hypothetical protein
MRQAAQCVLAGTALLLAACRRGDARGRESAKASAEPDTAQAPRVVPYDPTHSERAPRGQHSQPAPAPTNPQPATAGVVDSVGAPQAIVRDYYAAIRAHDFLRAYRMWNASGQSGGRSFAQFEAGFDSTESVDARVGTPGRVEGAAGSRFVSVPVEISARLRNGTAQGFTGTYTLRRVVVPGASAAQRRWHLYAASIRQVR